MNKSFEIMREKIPDQKAANELMARMFTVAQPDSVFSTPVTQGEYTVITASEVSVHLGFGYGAGGRITGKSAQENGEEDTFDDSDGFGGGGGGGGTAMARPVAVIEIGPHGVRVEPIVDPTKIALAFLTTLGAMAAMLAKIRQPARA